MKYKFNRLTSIIGIVLLCLVFFGCGKGGKVVSTVSSDSENEEEESIFLSNESMLNRPFLITDVDMTLSQIVIRDMESGRQFLYAYTLNTVFTDKYGQFVSVADFTPGRAMEIQEISTQGQLSKVAISDEIWEYDDIANYSIDAARGVFTVGVTNYKIRPDTAVFNDRLESELSEIGNNDVLRLVGVEKDIWAITVTTGHGTISLINTEVYDGSLICIGNIYTLINGNMMIEVPEGGYTVTVANNGYGGNIDVVVPRNNVVTVDLSTVVNNDLKTCVLTFRLSVPDATVALDGEVVEKDTELIVTYGKHSLSVEAPGYEPWTKVLYVNSPTATIVLDMEKAAGTGSSPNQNTDNNSEDNNVTSGGATQNGTDDKNNVELEYLTTIRDMISAITGI